MNSSSVLLRHVGVEESRRVSALVNALSRLSPGASRSSIPHSSRYWRHRSASRISAADKRHRMPASPCARLPLANAAGSLASDPAPSPVGVA